MRRGEIGKYIVKQTGNEQVRAFIPPPLPPKPELELTGTLLQEYEKALLALGRLDGISRIQSRLAPFLKMYGRKEALLSSQIEGTQSTLSEIMLYEMEQALGVKHADVIDIGNYEAAIAHGLRRLREDHFPLCNRLLREVHEILLAGGRGRDKRPGEFRRSQNWIGGSRPGNAVYVPPPPEEVATCMAALEQFLHAQDDGIPLLIRAGLAHVQFETIHPFLDGNGRLGRTLITLMLCETGMLSEPTLYISLFFKQHRGLYFDLLDRVRRTGNWEAWLDFFLQGVQETAEGATNTAASLWTLFESDRVAIEAIANRKTASVLRVHHILQKHPITSLSRISKQTGLTFPTASMAIEQLTKLGITREITGKRRGRLYAYDRYLAILSEGTEPL